MQVVPSHFYFGRVHVCNCIFKNANVSLASCTACMHIRRRAGVWGLLPPSKRLGCRAGFKSVIRTDAYSRGLLCGTYASCGRLCGSPYVGDAPVIIGFQSFMRVLASCIKIDLRFFGGGMRVYVARFEIMCRRVRVIASVVWICICKAGSFVLCICFCFSYEYFHILKARGEPQGAFQGLCALFF